MKIDTRKAVVRPMTHADKKAVLEIDKAVSGKERAGYIEAKFFRATEDKEQLLNSLGVEHEGRVELPEPLAAIPIDAACLRSGWRLMLDSLFPECAMYQRLLNPT